MAAGRPRIWLVDDEPHVLSGLTRTLRSGWDVTGFTDPSEALHALPKAVADQLDPAVLVSDMRMPGMDGAELLAMVRDVAPDTSRVLLTGQADVEAAVRAVNDGGVFRFLTKPCAPEQLLAGLQAALEQYWLVTAEKVLLQRTLAGAVSALSDTLSLAAPDLFSRTVRIKRMALAMARQAGLSLHWYDEIALTLAHLGTVSLPRRVLEKLEQRQELTADEQAMLDRIPDLSARLIAGIPRLEPVQAAVAASPLRYDGRGTPNGGPVGPDLPLAARLLRLATPLDGLLTAGMPPPEAVSLLARDAGAFDPALLEAARATGGSAKRNLQMLSVAQLQRGMIVAVDVKSTTGTLLIGRGSPVTAGLVERLRNHIDSGNLRGSIVVEVP
jgi:response regulator RpfG family c-di-GMP phosphodiesterase